MKLTAWTDSALMALAMAGTALGDYTPEALADQIVNLPGTDGLDINFNQFSGYVKVSETKNLHYWFVESQNDPANDPIAFWTNGGPGCSGLYGFMTENGPFSSVNADLTLSLNPYSWNRIANMVFVEQPCGVGFSYSDQESPYGEGGDYVTNDIQAATDNFALVQSFFDRFPQYRANDLYIASESYGGHYMPQLSKEIVDRNSAGADPVLNFKGMMVGNPGTTFYSIIPAGIDTYWGHQMISKPLYDGFVNDCRNAPHFNMTVCEAYYLAIYRAVGNVNPYAVDYPVCLEDKTQEDKAKKYGRGQRTWLMNHALNSLFHTKDPHTGETLALSAESQTALSSIREALHLEPVESYEPCAEDYMTQYLNQPAVKTALHVKEDIDWKDCSTTLRYATGDRHDDVTPIYNYLIDGDYGLNILVFSGDNDDVCATIGTQDWIWGLGYSVSGHPWEAYDVDGQVGGYLTKWSDTKLAFATVHGAGHEVPTYKPNVAYWLWENYLKGQLTNA
jgi:carboxypeptidase C (cathepsin A)